jgi:transcriptional regulator with XRE-family HTH domain
MPEPDYDRLAKAVRARRTSLGLRQADLGVSTARIGQIEQGKAAPLSALSTAAICRALGWTADSIERVLAGGEAEPLDKPAPATEASFSVDEKLAKLTPAKRAAVIAMLDAMLLDE